MHLCGGKKLPIREADGDVYGMPMGINQLEGIYNCSYDWYISGEGTKFIQTKCVADIASMKNESVNFEICKSYKTIL